MVLGSSLFSSLVLANRLVTEFELPQHHWSHYLVQPEVLAKFEEQRLQQDHYLGLFIQELAVQELARVWALSLQPDFSFAQLSVGQYNFSSMHNIQRQGRTPFAYFARTELKGLSSDDIKLEVLVQAHANQGHGDTGKGITLRVPLKLNLSLEQLQQFESIEQVKAWARAEVRLGE